MTRPRPLAIVGAVALGLAACSSSPSHPVAVRSARPGCPTGSTRVEVVLSDRLPVPVVHIPSGGCVEATVPRSPFPRATTEPPRVVPAGLLRLVSDSLKPDGTRSVVYLSGPSGSATISSTVSITTGVAIPEWSAVVLVG
jgi:hypothetical protein